jgi:hypothetical protein
VNPDLQRCYLMDGSAFRRTTEDNRPPLSAPLLEALEEIRSETEAAPMLDPSWTPAKGYGHADAILDALARSDAERFGSLSSRKEGNE